MKRTIIKIDEDKCTGCGNCVTGCHEGALQIIDGKARMISDLFCDGLGACIGECPVDAIELIEREAEPYDEIKVMDLISPKGENTVIAHLKHLKDHNEIELFNQGINYIKQHNLPINISSLMETKTPQHDPKDHQCGCPGSAAKEFKKTESTSTSAVDAPSELQQWPVQLHLLSPMAGYFKSADVLLAADCLAFSMGNFHSKLLKGKTLAIACPKLDSNQESYIEKLKAMIDDSKINTLTVAIMEVPCCGGLTRLAKLAAAQATRKIPIKEIVVSLQGEVLREEWI
ncbi:MAG: 4Fe-4S binding protein [Bacteroidota bacterium]